MPKPFTRNGVELGMEAVAQQGGRMWRAQPILPRPALRERAGVRVILNTRCLELATPDTWYFESPSPSPVVPGEGSCRARAIAQPGAVSLAHTAGGSPPSAGLPS